MRKTLAYFLKNRLHIIAILSFLLLMITFFYLVDADFVYQYEYYDEYDRLVKIISPENSPFSLLATAAAILSTITVIFEFYFKMRKVNVDQMYALPIKREKIFLSKLIVCYLEVIIPMEGAITYGAGERTARNTEAYVWNAAVNSGKGRAWRSYATTRGTLSMAKAYGYPVRCQKIQ